MSNSQKDILHVRFSEFYLCINNFCAVLKDAKSVSWTSLFPANRKAPSSCPLGCCYAWPRLTACVHDVIKLQSPKNEVCPRGFDWSRLRVVLHFLRHYETRSRENNPGEKRHDFHARSRFAHSTIAEEKWGTTRSLRLKINRKKIFVQVSSPEACFISKIQQFKLPSFHSAWHQNRNAVSLKKVSPFDFQ